MNLLWCVLLITAFADAIANDAAEVGATPPPDDIIGAYPQGKRETVGPFGVITSGEAFDDGEFEGVGSVIVYTDKRGVCGMRIQYVANEKFHIRIHGNNSTDQQEFVVDYPEEFITSIIGAQYYDSTVNESYISSLVFVTSSRRKSVLFGSGSLNTNNIVLSSQDGLKQVVGFLGRSHDRIVTLGARFDSKTYCHPKGVLEIVPKGGIEGDDASNSVFDDGAFDGVKKVTVRVTNWGIRYMSIQYVDCDKFQVREHGVLFDVDTEYEMEMEYPQEYITSVQISYSNSNNGNLVVKALVLLTSYARKNVLGMLDDINKTSVLEPESGRGAKLVGLIGSASFEFCGFYDFGARFHSEDISSAAKTESYYLWISLLLCVSVLSY